MCYEVLFDKSGFCVKRVVYNIIGLLMILFVMSIAKKEHKRKLNAYFICQTMEGKKRKL